LQIDGPKLVEGAGSVAVPGGTLNALGKSLAVDLKPRGIAVAQLHPGFVQTRMVNFGGLISPEESAAGLAQRIDALTLENSGGFWHSNGEALPW